MTTATLVDLLKRRLKANGITDAQVQRGGRIMNFYGKPTVDDGLKPSLPLLLPLALAAELSAPSACRSPSRGPPRPRQSRDRARRRVASPGKRATSMPRSRRPRRQQAGVPVLGRGLVPAVQSGQGDDLQSPGFRRPLAVLRSGLSRWRHPERAETRRALQGQRLSDDDPVQARRDRDHAPAGRGRRRSVHARAGAGNERGATGKGRRSPPRWRREVPELTPEEWRLLAYYSWDTDEQQVLPKDKVPATLQRLAQACPTDQRETAARLEIKALAAAAMATGTKPRDDKAARRRKCCNCSPSRSSHATTSMSSSTTAAAFRRRTRCPSPRNERSSTRRGTPRSIVLLADASLSTADRLSAVDAQIALARLDDPKAALPRCAAQVRARAGGTRRPRHDRCVRTAGGDQLGGRGPGRCRPARRIGRDAQGRVAALAFAVLLHARDWRPTPRRAATRPAALEWYEKAYAAADGPATRLQWGVSYVNALVDLSPQDAARIDTGAQERHR